MSHNDSKQVDACPGLRHGLNANYAKRANFAKTKIRVICLIRGIRVKDFPTLRKPYTIAMLDMITKLYFNHSQ